MIDLHCHILPGIDDGPATMDEALAMCRTAAADGIRTIAAATHFHPGQYEPTEHEVTARLQDLRRALASQAIPLTIIPAAEVLVTPELPAHLEQNDRLFINGNGRYFIAEFSRDVVPPRWNFLFTSLLRAGKTPVLTHPERHRWFADHIEELKDFVEKGGLVQITAMGLTGGLGEDVQEQAVNLLRNELVHVIASDGHDTVHRVPILSNAVSAAAEVVGIERARAMVTSNPQAIIEGRQINAPEPAPIAAAPKRKSWLR